MKARAAVTGIAALALVLPAFPGAGARAEDDAPPPIPPPCPGYQRVELNPGPSFSTAQDSNDRGQVVGVRRNGPDDELVVYLWDPRSGRQDLGPSAAPFADDRVIAINNRGQVTWTGRAADGEAHAVVWTPGRGIRDLGTLGGASSTPMDINDRGEVVGSSQTETGAVHAFFWSPRRGFRDLGDLSGDDDSPLPGGDVAVALNDRGQVVVRSYTWRPVDDINFRTDRGYFWDARSSQLVDLGTIDFYSRQAINERGQVLVDSGVWDARTGTVKRLTQRPNFRASDLNVRGEVVGGDMGGAVYWDTRSGRVRQTHLPYGGSEATSINDHGLVAVAASDQFEDWSTGTDLLWQPLAGRVCRLGEAAFYGASILVNNRGALAGWGYLELGAYVWTRHLHGTRTGE